MLGLCFAFSVPGLDASTLVPFPLNSPEFVSLTTDPTVTVGGTTIDFTSNLNQQFINFLFVQTDVSSLYGFPAYRDTIGIRARDGLALFALGGMFPASPDPNFANTAPAFPIGTTDLILFDVIIPGSFTQFFFTRTDLTGATGTASFFTPVPEPGTMLLSFAVLLLFFVLHRKRYLRITIGSPALVP